MDERLDDLLREEAARSDVVQWGVTAAVILAPVLFSFLGAVTSVIWSSHGPVWAASVWLFTSLAYVALLLRATPRSRSVLRLVVDHVDAREAIRRLERSVSDFKASTLVVETEGSYLAATRAMIAEAIRRGIRSEQDLDETLTEILYPIVVDGELFFGFRHAEKWSLSVYLYSRSSGALVNVWREKARTHPGRDRGRTLRPGEGHVGQAFLNKRPIITVDAGADEVLPFIAMPTTLMERYDTEVYRSFASFPIGPLTASSDLPIGVLVATSDDAGRFFTGNARILEEAAAVLALLVEATSLDLDRLRTPGDVTLSR